MRQKTGYNKNNKGPKGAGRGSAVRAGGVGTGRIHDSNTQHATQDDGKKTTIQQQIGTIYNGGNRCTKWKQVYDMTQ